MKNALSDKTATNGFAPAGRPSLPSLSDAHEWLTLVLGPRLRAVDAREARCRRIFRNFGCGFQRYAVSKLAVVTWLLEKIYSERLLLDHNP